MEKYYEKEGDTVLRIASKENMTPEEVVQFYEDKFKREA